MKDYIYDCLQIYALAIAISLIWFGIHYYLKHKGGSDLSDKEREWMDVSKFAGFLFLILPLILIVIIPLVEKVMGILIVIFIGLVVFLYSLFRKGKI